MKSIGKPCTGKPYARFDEGGLVKLSMKWLLRHRQTKGAETDRPFLQMSNPALYSTSNSQALSGRGDKRPSALLCSLYG